MRFSSRTIKITTQLLSQDFLRRYWWWHGENFDPSYPADKRTLFSPTPTLAQLDKEYWGGKFVSTESGDAKVIAPSSPYWTRFKLIRTELVTWWERIQLSWYYNRVKYEWIDNLEFPATETVLPDQQPDAAPPTTKEKEKDPDIGGKEKAYASEAELAARKTTRTEQLDAEVHDAVARGEPQTAWIRL